MKKLVTLLIAGAMCLSLTACKQDEPAPSNPTTLVVEPENNDDDGDNDDGDFNEADFEAVMEYYNEIMEMLGGYEDMQADFEYLVETAKDLEDGEEFDEDEFEKWTETFFALTKTYDEIYGKLNSMTDIHPAAQETHEETLKELEKALNVLKDFEKVVKTAVDGDTDDFYAGLADFIAEINPEHDYDDFDFDDFDFEDFGDGDDGDND